MPTYKPNDISEPAPFAQKHYTPHEIAALWSVHANTVRRIFEKEPGVLHIGKPLSTRRRGYISLRIPESVLQRVHDRLTGIPR